MATIMSNPAASSQSTVKLSAWADVANGVGALVYLVINGVRVGEPQYVTAGRWSGQPAQDLTFTFDTPAKVDSIAIEFANDMVGGGDRSLYINSLSVNDVALTASEATLATPWGPERGTWNIWYNAKLTYDMTGRPDIFKPVSSGISKTGTDAAETLSGADTADTLNGAGGNDTLIGGAGNDQLTGGSGADVFRFAKGGGKDVITDFNAAQGDRIDLTGTGITGLDKLQITSSGTTHAIGLGDGSTVTVTASTAPQANWFKFDPATNTGTDGGTTTPPSGSTKSTVQLSAWADVANGVGALVYLVVNGVRVGEPQYVTAGRWSGQAAQNLTFTFDTPAKVDSIALEFANDMVDGGNRSLYINGLKVNGVALTASESTLVTPWGNQGGTWDVWYNASVRYDMTNRQDIFKPVPGVVKNGTEGADSLAGAGGADTLNGAGGNDTLLGGDGKDSLNGGAGDDLLNGDAGADTMIGSTGNDRYVVASTDDVVTELANEGADTVEASVSWTLGANTEHLTLTGSADLNGTGNGLDNLIVGNSGSNLLSGGSGADTLDGGANASAKTDTFAGGAGDDVFIVRSNADVVRENANEGTDLVRASVSHTLAAHVEHLALTGAANLNGTGNDLSNRIEGNGGANLLQGMQGNDTILGGDGGDTLIGGTGNDELTGGSGADMFRFAKGGGQDIITDFNVAQGDRIDLTGTGITGMEQMSLNPYAAGAPGYTLGLGDGTTIALRFNPAPASHWFIFDTVAGGGGTDGGTTTPPSGSTGDQIFTWEGISLPSYWGGRYQTPGADAAFNQIKATGANTVTLIPNFFMPDQTSNTMQLNPGESDTFAQVQKGIIDAAAKGLKVVLKPHVETNNRVWRAEIAPSDPDLWFANYKSMMVEYAKVAQAAGASMFVIGTEMKSMTVAQYTSKWVDIINAVKAVYSGPVTYSATDSEAAQVQFWDKLDYIGINSYFPMTTGNTPTVPELIDAWVKKSPIGYTDYIHKGLSTIDYHKSIADQWGKKVIYTEIGYGSYDGANKDPGTGTGSSTVDYQEQVDLYEAFYHVVENYGGQWLDGAFLWQYHPFADPTAEAGVPQTEFTTQGKPANAVITEHYSGPAHEAGLTWNGTASADKLNGGFHNDTVSGAGGNDTLWGGAGHDVLSGGTGADRFEFGSGSGTDTITDFEVAVANEVIAIARNPNGLELSSFAQIMARASSVGSDTVIDLGGGHTLKLTGVSKAQLTADDFLFV